MKLRYLFCAQYKDASYFKQPPEDVSSADPQKSAFFDVRQDDLIRFGLYGENQSFVVDLRDGHFEVNGTTVWLGERMPPQTPLRLVFYRQHTHQFNLGAEEIDHQVRYCIGWQATIDGKNVKQVLGVF